MEFPLQVSPHDSYPHSRLATISMYILQSHAIKRPLPLGLKPLNILSGMDLGLLALEWVELRRLSGLGRKLLRVWIRRVTVTGLWPLRK